MPQDEFELKIEEESDEEREEQSKKVAEKLGINELDENNSKKLAKLNDVELRQFASADLTIAGELPIDPLGAATEGSNKQIDEANKITAKTLTENVAKLSQQKQLDPRIPLISAIFGVLSFFSSGTIAGVALYEAISSKAQNTPSPVWDLLPDDVKDTIEVLVKNWISMKDDKLWDAVATYVSNFNPNITVQMLIMQDIIQFTPSVDWKWSAEDKANTANDLVLAYKNNKDFADIYRKVKDITFNDKELPRSVAAEVSRIALALILNEFDS